MIERRRKVVLFHQGDDLARLTELRDELERVALTEANAPRRHSSKSELPRLAKEHDELQDAADERAVKVTVWALTNDQFEQLSELHPPRDGDARDAQHKLDMSSVPGAMLRASLVAPDESPSDVRKAVEKGAAILASLGVLSRVQLHRLETDAWNINVEDDTLGKFSAVSLLRQERAREREQQPVTE